MTPERARQVLSSQAMRGFAAEIEITEAERWIILAYINDAPISMSVRDMICRIGRGDDPERFPAVLVAARGAA